MRVQGVRVSRHPMARTKQTIRRPNNGVLRPEAAAFIARMRAANEARKKPAPAIIVPKAAAFIARMRATSEEEKKPVPLTIPTQEETRLDPFVFIDEKTSECNCCAADVIERARARARTILRIHYSTGLAGKVAFLTSEPVAMQEMEAVECQFTSMYPEFVDRLSLAAYQYPDERFPTALNVVAEII